MTRKTFAERVCGVSLDLPQPDREARGIGRCLIIGEAPQVGYDHSDALPASLESTSRLRSLMGIGQYEFETRFDRVNLYDRSAGFERLSEEFARLLARDAYVILRRYSRVLLLGSTVRAAFDQYLGTVPPGLRWLHWRVLEQNGGATATLVASLPHPTGQDHAWKDLKRVQACREFLAGLVADVRASDWTAVARMPSWTMTGERNRELELSIAKSVIESLYITG